MKEKNPATGELLALGKVARADTYACGHIILTLEQLRIGFSRADFREFAQTVALAAENLENREALRAEWGLFM